jgi:dihydroorotate dehydrogenase subfamily 1
VAKTEGLGDETLVDLSVEICGLRFRNPVMPAAGPNVYNGDMLLKAAEGGAGGLVAKTVSVRPAEIPRPCMVKVKDSMLSADPWSDIPLERWVKEEYKKGKSAGLPLIASIGHRAEEIRELAPKVVNAGVDALELSTQYLGDPDAIGEVTRAAKETVGIPVFVKLGLNTRSIEESAKVAEEAGADAIVAVNVLGPCLVIDIENAMPVLGSAGGWGWLSGPAIKPFALKCVADIARAVKIPVIGVGGVSSGRDAVEFIMVGASAVQVCTAAIVHGHKIYGLIADQMTKFMRAKGYNSISDFKGMALPHLSRETPHTVSRPVEVIASRCNACGLCERHCLYGAIRIIGKIARVDPVKCPGCGLCVSVCPTRAVRF